MANLLDIRTWNEGFGSIGDFGQIGSDSLNLRSLKPDPWNNDTILWSSVSAKSIGVAGGFSVRPRINSSLKYRYCVWVYKDASANTNFSMDSTEYDSGDNPIGSVKYGFNYVLGSISTWLLHIVYIFPYNWTLTGFPEGASYYQNGVLYNYHTDLKWDQSCVSTKIGTSMYNNTTTSGYKQSYVYPRFEICDGTEPTIEQLLTNRKYARMLKTSTGTFAINTRRL